jgi:hypothetical protein
MLLGRAFGLLHNTQIQPEMAMTRGGEYMDQYIVHS